MNPWTFSTRVCYVNHSAPNHVCIITPERLGLCGAYNWLDGKAAYEIDETGPNQPVKKAIASTRRRASGKASTNSYILTATKQSKPSALIR